MCMYPDNYPSDEQPDRLKARCPAPPPSKGKEEDSDAITPAPSKQIDRQENIYSEEQEQAPETRTEEQSPVQNKPADNARDYGKAYVGEYLPDQPFAHTVPLRDWIWSGSSRRRPKPSQSSNSDPLPSLDEAPQTLSPSFTPINGPEAKAKKERERREGRPVYESSEMAWRLATSADEKAQEEVEKKVLEWDDGGIDPSQWE